MLLYIFILCQYSLYSRGLFKDLETIFYINQVTIPRYISFYDRKGDYYTKLF